MQNTTTHLHNILDGMSVELAALPAIICADSGVTLNYGELARKVDAVSASFLRLGFARGDRVGIIARKSPDVIATFLGASRAGVVFAPLDPAASPEYWATVLEDFEISSVLTNIAGLDDKLVGVRVLDIETEFGEARETVACNNGTAAVRTDNDDAYILATSGSTGRPKGVVLSHKNALSFANWAADAVSLSPSDYVLSVAPFHFDLSVFDIYASLGRGACVVLAPGMATMFPGQLVEAIERFQVAVLYTVPTVLRTLLEAGAFANDGGKSLKTIMYAGEPFPAPLLAQLMNELPHVTFLNFFGPTETNVCLAHRFSSPPDPASEIPIGQPASSAIITLFNETGAPVSQGEVGEIFVDGPAVMKGYIKADGFHRAQRPFATGDFAELGADGCYYFRGRRDNQVKVRGSRIELGSVERALVGVEGVQDSVALVVGRDLVGFVGGTRAFNHAELREACGRSLPPGAVPHRFVPMEHLPRLSNGKLDLVRLKSLARADVGANG